MEIGNREFSLGKKTYVMGILNVTPDSFSDGGTHNDTDSALCHAEKLIQEGADIIDVGGESTRPGHVQIGDEEEIYRVVPVIEGLKKEFDVPVSIDTYKSAVAEAALAAGADLLNDVWGLKYDDKIAAAAARYKVPVCLMHNRDNTDYNDFVKEVVLELQNSVKLAKEAGIKEEQIILDPGIGFGKTYEQNLIIMNHLEEIVRLGYPVLLGTSRKSVIGLTLDLPVDEREEGTIATSVLGAMKGCDFVRVHDVKKNVRALKMIDRIIRR
ncbi:MAG: dihydropteroate synthase [Lachnospiraceae bacterium]|nr:dihydropteroate synthase [Lachnospiraceae bacterium]